MAKQNTRRRSNNPKDASKLAVARDASVAKNPRRRRSRRNPKRRKNMSTAGKVAIVVGAVVVGVPLVVLAVGAVVVGKIAGKMIDDMPTIPPQTPTQPVYPGMS